MSSIKNSFILSILLFLTLAPNTVTSQSVYKTPSGAKYHLSSCRMVENVARKVSTEDIRSLNLGACKFCEPPQVNFLSQSFGTSDKSVGESTSVRCRGYTQKGTLCKHNTRLANGYCFQHTGQAKQGMSKKLKSTTSSSRCGARTKSGKSCRRKVSGGGRCYQH